MLAGLKLTLVRVKECLKRLVLALRLHGELAAVVQVPGLGHSAG